MKLGTRLLRDGVIGLSELEAALRAQVLYGGRLGTNLIELGFLDVDTVGRFLALALQAPEATRDRFERVPLAAIERFGGELARAHSAFPLGPEIDRPDHLGVAVLDPSDAGKQALLAEALGSPVVLYAAAEMRLFFYLEKHYGIERAVRYIRPGDRPREQGQVERRRLQGAPRVVRVEPRSRRIAAVEAPEPEPAPAAGSPPASEPQPTIRDRESVSAAIAAAKHRDQIGAALVSYAPARLEALAVLLIRARTAMGWCAWSAAGTDDESLAQVAVPLEALSAFKLAYDANESYFGPPPTDEARREIEVFAAMGIGERPERLLVVPVSVRDRVVNLIAAFAPDIDAETRSELATLAREAGDAYLRLIRGFKVNA
jgi:hypothetical protein